MKNLSGGRGVVAFSEEAFTARFKALWLACVNPATGSPYTPRAAAAQLRGLGYSLSPSAIQTLLSGSRANPRLSTLVACSALLDEPLERFAVRAAVTSERGRADRA